MTKKKTPATVASHAFTNTIGERLATAREPTSKQLAGQQMRRALIENWKAVSADLDNRNLTRLLTVAQGALNNSNMGRSKDSFPCTGCYERYVAPGQTCAHCGMAF